MSPKKSPRGIIVWVGRVNGKPHKFHDSRYMRDGQRMLTVYTSRRAAKQGYADVHKMRLTEAP